MDMTEPTVATTLMSASPIPVSMVANAWMGLTPTPVDAARGLWGPIARLLTTRAPWPHVTMEQHAMPSRMSGEMALNIRANVLLAMGEILVIRI